MRAGHDEGGRHALVGDVADGDPDPPVAHLDEVVEVATDRAGGPVIGGDLPLRQVRQLARQELLLDQGGDPHLLVQALALGGLVGLFADELGDADGRGGLGGQGRQEPAIVGRVLLLGEAGPRFSVPISSPCETSGTTQRDRRPREGP